jgi:hypothetical protein
MFITTAIFAGWRIGWGWFDASNLCRCAKLDADADGLTSATPPVKTGPADVTLHIGPVLVDVTGEGKSIVVPPPWQVSYQFTPRPAGVRWVHTHVMPGSNLYSGLYTGEFGIVYIGPPIRLRKPNGWEIAYQTFTASLYREDRVAAHGIRP